LYVGTLTCTSCSQTTVNKYGAGNITLTATVSNSSTSYSLNKSVHIGGYGSGDYPVSGPSSANCNGYVTYSTNQLPGATSYTWFYPGGWNYVSGQGTRYLTLVAQGSSGNYQVGVRVANACDAGGSYAVKNTYLNCSGYYMMAPNPAKSTVTISSEVNNMNNTTISTNTASGQTTSSKTISQINVYDELGNLKIHKGYDKVKSVRLNINALSIGIYTVEIIEGDYKETKKLQVL
jgi:hypothetical protein